MLLLFFALLAASVFSSHISRVSPYANTSCTACVSSANCSSTRLTAPIISLQFSGNCGNPGCQDNWGILVPNLVEDINSVYSWASKPVVKSTSWIKQTDFRCDNGYYVFGIGYGCSSGSRSGTWTSLICNVPTNLLIATPNLTYSDQGAMSCGPGQYLVGFSTGNNVHYGGNNLICATPGDVVCDNPVTTDPSANTVMVNNSCGSNIHQWCVVIVACKQYYEPASGSSNVECQPAATSSNSKGAYNTSVLRCSDINECLNTSAACGANSTCINVIGGPPTCGCVAGYTRVNNTCVNVNECLKGQCVPFNEPNPVLKQCNNCPSDTTCNDTQGGFICIQNSNPCNTSCTALITTNCYICSPLATSCTYNNPTYSCTCPLGYTTPDNGLTCVDVDECSDGSALCNASSTTCQNVNGSYNCLCLPGYQRTSNYSCAPINECLNAAACPNPNQCVDTTPFYYCLPQILNVTKNNTSLTPFTLSSTTQQPPDSIFFTILKETSCVRTNTVFYGANFQHQTSPCVVSNSSNTSNSYILVCGMSMGGGVNLSFSLQCCPSNQPCVYIPATSFLFSYPKPTLTPKTLTYSGNPDPTGTVNVGAAQAGLVVTMQGTNFVPSDTLVYFGTGANPLLYTCTVTAISPPFVMCAPQIVTGTNYTFTVVVGSGSNAQISAPGVDLLSFVGDPPVVYNITGCTKDGIGVKDCPTEGGVQLWVVGKTAKGLSLMRPQLFIGGRLCVQQGVADYSQGFWCWLPPGSGMGLQVELRDETASWFGSIVSYAAPQITRLSSDSCANLSPLSLANCSAPVSLSIEGNNFGASTAVVIVESVVVAAVQVPFLTTPMVLNGKHHYIIANISSPPSTINAVTVQQLNGGYSSENANFTLMACGVGYGRMNNMCVKCDVGRFAMGEVCVLCDMGSFQASAGHTTCMVCPVGTIQPLTGQSNCSECAAGSFSNVAQTACESCAPGKFNQLAKSSGCMDCNAGLYQSNIGGTSCIGCPAGTYSTPNAIACNNCFPGRVSETTGSGVCVVCPPGTSQPLEGQTYCADCDLGTFTAFPASPLCLQCPYGMYQNLTRQTSCMLCTPGSAQNSLRGSTCTECDVGTFSFGLGSVRCQNCEAGSYSNSPGASGCTLCDVGSFQPNAGSSGCTVCSPGTYSAYPGLDRCVQCEEGYFQNSPGMSSCIACPVGKYVNARAAQQCVVCDPGKFQIGIGQQSCMGCAPGTYQPLSGAVNCLPCSAGSASVKEASTACDICPAATFSLDRGSVCIPCPLNTVQPFENKSACVMCSPGSSPNELGTGCQCQTGYYSYYTSLGVLLCAKCPAGSGPCVKVGQTFDAITTLSGWWRKDSNASIFYRCNIPTFCLGYDTCQVNRQGPLCALCIPGYKSSGSGSACEACPSTRAASWGITIAIVLVLLLLLIVLYYIALRVANAQQARLFTIIEFNNKIAQERLAARLRTDDSHFADLRKEIQHSRQNSRPSSRRSSRTTGNSAMPAAISVSNMTSNAASTPSTPVNSPSGTVSPRGNVGNISFLPPVITTTLANNGSSNSNNSSPGGGSSLNSNTVGRKNISMDFNTSMTDNTNMNALYFPEIYETDYEAEGREAEEAAAKPDIDSTYAQLKATAEDTSRRAPNFMYKVKILIGFFQIASYLPSQGDIQWPSAYVTFIDAFSIFNFDFIPWQSLGCAASINYFVKSVIVGFIPVAATVILVIFFIVGLYLSDTSSLLTQMEKGQRRAALWLQFVRLLLFTVFLLYPLVSKSAFGLFNCVTVEGVSYLVADFELLCYDSKWTAYAAIDGIFVVLYPIGIPLIYFQILRMNLSRMREPETILSLGFLYEAYTDEAWYWELVDMLHKLVLTSIVVFTPNPQRMAWNMGIIGMYLILLLLRMPYVRKGDDRFHQQVQATLFCIAFVGFILREENPYNTPFASAIAMERLIAALLIMIVLVLMLSFIVIAGRNIQKIFRARQRAKKLAINVVQPVMLNPFVIPHSASNSKSSNEKNNNNNNSNTSKNNSSTKSNEGVNLSLQK